MKKTFLSKFLLSGIASLAFINLDAQNTNYGTGSGTGGTSNSFFGYQAGNATTQNSNTFLGAYAGQVNSTGKQNVFIGTSAGKQNTTGYNNVFIGSGSGSKNTVGLQNVFIGYNAGLNNLSGNYNFFMGQDAGKFNQTGERNTFIGSSAGYFNVSGSDNLFIGEETGSNNTESNNIFIGNLSGYNNETGVNNLFLGHYTGYSNNGSGNVFLGDHAGENETGSNLLYIANSNTTSPLVLGNFSTGQFGINTNKLATGYALSVNGAIISTELRIQAFASWPDYVFKKEYRLLSLNEVEKQIKENGHLPNVDSADEIAENGFPVGQMNAKLMEKVEELTLYLIEQDKKLVKQNEEIIALKEALQELKTNKSN
jgi:hypothetical protein